MRADIQVIPFELNIRMQKWILLPIYRAQIKNISFFAEHISRLIDNLEWSSIVLVFRDYSMGPNHENLAPLLKEHNH